MEKIDWRDRLRAAIKADGRKPRRISEDAGLSVNYVSQQILSSKSKAGPGIKQVIKLCEALNVSVAYICSGVDMTPEVEKFLAKWSRISQQDREHVLALLGRLELTDQDIEAHDADYLEIAEKK